MRRPYRIALGWLIAGLIVVTIAIALLGPLHEARNALASISLFWFCVLLLPGGLMMVASGLSFALLLLPESGNWPQRSTIVGIYLVAQIVKYLPGRIWGLVYQFKRLTELVHVSQCIVANVNHMILNFFISMLSLGLAFNVPEAWLLIFFGVLLGLFWIQRGGVAVYLTWVAKIPSATLAPLPVQTVFGIGVSLALEWGGYLVLWTGLFVLLCIPPEPEMIIALASLYTSASILCGLVSIIPGGLGIREGGFVMLSLGLRLGIAESELIALAILARLALSLAETMTGVLATVYLRKRNLV